MLGPHPATAQPSTQDTLDVQASIIAYHEGFSTGNVARAPAALSDALYMFNGNFSGEPTNWQAHQYLSGDALRNWPALMIKQTGPFTNQYEFVQASIRGGAALVVTRETGQNQFRNWSDEVVTWMLGRGEGGWQIVGLFIRDVSNPGSE